MIEDWLKHILVLISGGAIWEGVKFLFPSIQQYIKNRREARKEFNQNIVPILKAADELYGKLWSLAEEDFATFINVRNSRSIDVLQNRKYVYYLFAQFWAQLEYIRLKSQYHSIVKIKKGSHLLRFIEGVESTDFRILDRSVQRMIGESLIENSTHGFKIMTLNQFVNSLQNPNSTHNIWIQQLENVLLQVSDKKNRQRVLRFGIIVAALIDHFDPQKSIVRRRGIYRNKLNKASSVILKRQLFDHYFMFIERPEIYLK